MRAIAYMCVCSRRPVSLYTILYKKCVKSALPQFLVSKCETALNRLLQAETRDLPDSEARKKQDFIPNQHSDTNKKDKHRSINTITCFQAANRVLAGIRRIALQSTASLKRIAESIFDEIIEQVRAQALSNAACLHLSRVLGAE